MRVKIEASSEVSTIIAVDIPISPQGSVKAQVEGYIEKYFNELAEKVKDNLIRNFNSDWKENLFFKAEYRA